MQKEYIIKLGERSWTIAAPLKFKQLSLIEPAMTEIINMKIAGEKTSSRFYDEMANVLLAVITPIDTSFTRASLDDLPVDVADLTSAMQIVARAAGMWKDPKPGEDQPGETPAKPPNP